MSIWKRDINLNALNALSQNTLIAHLGIQYTEIGDDFIKAEMPVDQRTQQPFGVLHGGASAVLAETIGSLAGYLAVDEDKICVGVELNASHLRSVSEGCVIGVVKAVRIGRTLQVWQIDITDQAERLICSSRLTVSVIDKTI
ncbi:hotdog fold thioesterase [Psychromonas sp. PT13]|uniref:hotdog fold thioesterase n=1 Tax=Psychromonas sp. PT13 TaxID=3439547 RepID=UPI003EB92E11